MLSLILFAGFWNTAGLLPAFRLYLLDDLCRIASDDSQGRDIARHHAIGPHDCPVTYPHAGQHCGIDAIHTLSSMTIGRPYVALRLSGSGSWLMVMRFTLGAMNTSLPMVMPPRSKNVQPC